MIKIIKVKGLEQLKLLKKLPFDCIIVDKDNNELLNQNYEN